MANSTISRNLLLTELHTLDTYTIITYVIVTMFALCQVLIVRKIAPHLRNFANLRQQTWIEEPTIGNRENV